MQLITILAAGLGAVAASANSIRSQRPRCGTSEPSAEYIQENNFIASQGLRAKFAGTRWANQSISVDVYFHVVASSTALIDGYVTDEMLSDQFNVMTDDFAPYSISFTLKNTTRTINAQWATASTGNEFPMKRALHQGGYNALNVYFQKTMGDGLLGYSTSPFSAPSTFDIIQDGIVIISSSLPGGSWVGFNLGKTVIHEAGHWFGLYHTFLGGCLGTNDGIDDTPAQATQTTGCPIGRDSCPNQPGLDPIHNYMDDSDDDCYEEFTPGQVARIYAMWAKFRA